MLQHLFSEGKLTLEVYGGYGEIGGNCIVIKDGNRKIAFDNGIRFSVLRRYYRGRIQPLGPSELRSLEAIPPLKAYEEIDALYISHLHLDHLGLLGALPPGTKVYVPSIKSLAIVEGWYRASPTWLAELPHRLNVEVLEAEPYREDEQSVIPVPVSHSAYPSYAFVYKGSDRTVLYSGDLRVSGPLSPELDTVKSLERALKGLKVDLAMLEGTNIGEPETPIGPDEFKGVLNRAMMDAELIMISIDPLDLELLSAVLRLAGLNGRTPIIASPRVLEALPLLLEGGLLPEGSAIVAASELEEPPPIPLKIISIREEALKAPGSHVIVQDPVGFLEMLRKMKLWGEELPKNGVAILTTPEPLEAEAEVEEETLAAWLYSLGVQTYRLRPSGHYYPHELRRLLNAIKPAKLIPIHTNRPDLLLALTSLLTR